MSLPGKVPNAHGRLSAKLTDALAAKGWVVVPAPVNGQCGDAARCPDVAATASARHRLRMSGAPNEDDGYDFLLELLAPDGATMQRRAAFCNYCDVDRLGEVATAYALELLEGEPARALPAPKPPAPARVPLAPAVTAPSVGRRAAWPPWVLVAGGVAAAGYGAWALHKDGMTDSCQPSAVATTCTRYSSETIGVVGITVGAALVVSGVVWALLRARVSGGTAHARAATATR